MTIRYKSDTFDLTTTNLTTILTCPSDATIIVKSLQANHKAASNRCNRRCLCKKIWWV
jgi:hypothetical protein